VGGNVTVDPGALRTVGTKLKESASRVSSTVADFERQQFGPGDAGRDYADEGKKLQDGLGHLAMWLKNWSGAVDKTGTQFVASGDAYERTEDATVHKIKAVVV
jgi:hypothetical protein